MSWRNERYPRTRADWLGLDLPVVRGTGSKLEHTNRLQGVRGAFRAA